MTVVEDRLRCPIRTQNMAESNGTASSNAQLLWQHPSPQDTKLWDFLQRVNNKYGKSFKTYHELYQWSIENVSDSWGEIWDYVGIRASQPYNKVLSDEKTMFPRPAWFPGATFHRDAAGYRTIFTAMRNEPFDQSLENLVCICSQALHDTR